MNKWKALIRNVSPYALVGSVGVFTVWLGPYEQDYWEFPSGVQSITLYPQNLSLFAGFNVIIVGFVLVTAFDQSSDYDGEFPVALTPPSVEIAQPTGPFNVSTQLKQTGAVIQGGESSALKVGVALLADPNNAGAIYIGGADISVASAYLEPGEGLVYPLDNVEDLYTLGTSGDILNIWGF
jgi:hypothetical protein